MTGGAVPGRVALVLLFSAALAGMGVSPSAPGAPEALKEVVSKVSKFWHGKDVAKLEGLLHPDGIRFQVDDEKRVSLDPRKAMASIQAYWAGLTSRKVDTRRISDVGGDPPKGFAEFRWHVVLSGGSETLVHAIYVGFVRRDERWVISEIRILR